ncbi:MAG: hypothetical protein KDB03_28725 [Planctomycetales bacterium]|nr:hypothetical protein [Planctomycetales bacterium]
MTRSHWQSQWHPETLINLVELVSSLRDYRMVGALFLGLTSEALIYRRVRDWE